MIMGNSKAQENWKAIHLLHSRLQVLSSSGNSHHRLFNDYFINYNEVFSSKIDIHTRDVLERSECMGIKLKFGASCPLINQPSQAEPRTKWHSLRTKIHQKTNNSTRLQNEPKKGIAIKGLTTHYTKLTMWLSMEFAANVIG